ncbi:TssN family type VI secretion system protein [Chitinophaga sp. G-6-1-13]|uniref:TssN family type VI secretion system protein n=2 Tax=Chitinophaga fulva TaxID=2728842 RepID=A0A848GIK6_9BACT|nr:TssN family type VI secretion system protein [Chitinophaga fulva]
MRYTAKFYLMLAGVMAVGSIIVALLSRYIKNFSLFKKKALLYLACMTLIFAVISSIPFLFTHKNLMDQYLFYQVWFLGLGILHCHFMYTRFWANETTLGSELAFIVAIWLFGGVGFVLVNRFLDKDAFLYYPMLTSMFAFVLPTFVYKTFEKMMAIPVKVHKWWQYPMYKEVPEVNDDDMRDLIVIGLEMEKGNGDRNRTYFRARTPIKMDLGDLFYHFINDYNDRYPNTPIDFVDDNGQAYGWVFHLKPRWFGGAKTLDPHKAVFMNGIKENSVIICNRIMLS